MTFLYMYVRLSNSLNVPQQLGLPNRLFSILYLVGNVLDIKIFILSTITFLCASFSC